VVAVAAHERDHLVGLAAMAALTAAWPARKASSASVLEAAVGGGALDEAEAGDAALGAGDLRLDDFLQGLAGAAELGVAEGASAFSRKRSCRPCIDEALADDDDGSASRA
jgi:hypothetical protein